MMSSRLKLNLKQQYKRRTAVVSVIYRKLFVGWKIATNLCERERERESSKVLVLTSLQAGCWRDLQHKFGV
jgi:hypothetical protein